ncbi:MAG TPA: metallophosphoesterase family protein [Gemmatimonadaceae bacterium]|nr:metallophosphoesterase family protein [Gemmatimonadaceae bacterium]
MRYALISDIHGNLPALEAVLRDIEKRRIDATYHLGDLTGYSPWPNEVIAALRQHGIQGIAGNYDSTLATDYKHCGCRADSPHEEELSHISYEWTRRHVNADTKSYLAALPFRIDIRPLGGHLSGPTITLLHGNQALNTVYITEDRPDAFLEKMAAGVGAAAGDAVCFGHTHKPWQRAVNGIQFINAGSAGRPKDGDARACYVIVSADNGQLNAEFIRVVYDVELVAREILQAGLPGEFADVIRTGGKALQPAG